MSTQLDGCFGTKMVDNVSALLGAKPHYGGFAIIGDRDDGCGRVLNVIGTRTTVSRVILRDCIRNARVYVWRGRKTGWVDITVTIQGAKQ